MNRRARNPSWPLLPTLAFAALSLGWPSTGTAVEVRVAGELASQMVVGAGERVDDSLVVAAEVVRIDGVVAGNLIAAARRIVVSGVIEGDLIAAAREIELSGTVQGNVFTFSQTVELNAQVEGSSHSFAEKVRLRPTARVDQDSIAFGSEVMVDGSIGRDLLAFAGTTELGGTVGRNLTAWTGRLFVFAPGNVEGDLTAHVRDSENVDVDPDAFIGGNRDVQIRPQTFREDRSRFSQPSFYTGQLLRIGAGLVTGLALFSLFPALFANRPTAPAALLRSAGIGFLALVATPVAAVIAMITVLGLPVGLLAMLSWLAALYFAVLIVAAFAGQALLKTPFDRLGSFALALLVGLLLWAVVTSVPLVGGLVRFVAVLLGLGVIVNQLRTTVTISGSAR